MHHYCFRLLGLHKQRNSIGQPHPFITGATILLLWSFLFPGHHSNSVSPPSPAPSLHPGHPRPSACPEAGHRHSACWLMVAWLPEVLAVQAFINFCSHLHLVRFTRQNCRSPLSWHGLSPLWLSPLTFQGSCNAYLHICRCGFWSAFGQISKRAGFLCVQTQGLTKELQASIVSLNERVTVIPVDI